MGLFDRGSAAEQGVPPPANAPLTVKTASVDVRRGFLRKVYALLTLNFAITIGISCLFAYVDPIRVFLVEHTWIVYVAMGVAFAALITLSCFRIAFPANLILMYVFVLAFSVLIGTVVATYYERGWGAIVLLAFIATAVVFLSITTFVFVTKMDFSFLYGFLGAALIVLIVLSLFSFLIPFPRNGRSRAFNFGISLLGYVTTIHPSSSSFTSSLSRHLTNISRPSPTCAFVLLFHSVQPLVMTGYLLADTSMVITRYGPDQWLQAVISLYVDVTNLFLFLLNIFSFVSN